MKLPFGNVNMKKILITIILTIVFVLFFELIVYKISNKKNNTHSTIEYRKSGFKMINPVLDFYELEPILVKEVRELQSNLTEYIVKAEEEKKIEMASVYFRDLNNGPWIGVGEDEHYAPASLLKVPVLIACLKYAEDNPEFLSKKIVYTEQNKNSRRNITDGFILQPNKVYTIDELLEFMIIHSDNDAVNILQNKISKALMHDIYYDLGIPIESHTDGNSITVKEYAAYFRILFNATYLNKKMSEKALTILSKTTFKQGIVAGVPKGVMIAHKFGERYLIHEGLTQLHDCGIVYKSKKPYLICVMTRGKNIEVLKKVISDLSAIIYNSEATKAH